jgi:hypothetical protein
MIASTTPVVMAPLTVFSGCMFYPSIVVAVVDRCAAIPILLRR